MRRPSLATVLAGTALFVALGGPAEAAKLVNGSQIRTGTVTGKQVKNSSLTGADVRNRSLVLTDLSVAARRSLTATPQNAVGAAQLQDGAVTTGKLATGAVTGPVIADGTIGAQELLTGSVGAAAIADGGVGTAEVADGAITRAEIAADAVDHSRVADGSLRASDFAGHRGRLVDLDFGNLPGGSCKTVTSTSLTPVNGSQNLLDDVILLTPSQGFPQTITVSARPGGPDTIGVAVCNPTAGAVIVGPQSFRYLTIDTSA